MEHIEVEDIPINFAMELAMHREAMEDYAKLTDEERLTVIQEAKNKKTKDAMRNYVTNHFK